jgi:hypothetical protein
MDITAPVFELIDLAIGIVSQSTDGIGIGGDLSDACAKGVLSGNPMVRLWKTVNSKSERSPQISCSIESFNLLDVAFDCEQNQRQYNLLILRAGSHLKSQKRDPIEHSIRD